MHLTAVNDHHDNRAVLRLTDGRARLLLVQTGACDQILAVDDERRVELHRVAQTGGIVERTDLQMILVVKADDLPAVAYCVLILLSLAFQEAVHGAARAVAVKIGKAGGVDAQNGVIISHHIGYERAVIAKALARADIDILGLFAERDLARVLHAERVLAGLLNDQDAVRGVDRQNRVALLSLEAGVVVRLARLADQVDVDLVVAVLQILRIIRQKALKFALVQLTEHGIEFVLRCFGGVLLFLLPCAVPVADDALLLLVHQVALGHHLVDDVLRDEPGSQPLVRHGAHCGFDVPLTPASDERVRCVQKKRIHNRDADQKKAGQSQCEAVFCAVHSCCSFSLSPGTAGYGSGLSLS